MVHDFNKHLGGRDWLTSQFEASLVHIHTKSGKNKTPPKNLRINKSIEYQNEPGLIAPQDSSVSQRIPEVNYELG